MNTDIIKKKDAEGYYTIERYDAILDENGEYQCGELLSTEEHQNTMQNGFMYLSNVIGAGCGGQDTQTYNTTIDGTYYSGYTNWDVWRLGFGMAISTRKYYGPQVSIGYDAYNTSAVNDNYDLIVGNWINGSTLPVYTAPSGSTPGSCVYTRRFEPPATITREINTILLYNNQVTFGYRTKPLISVVQLDTPCYQYPNQILVIKYRILFNQDSTKYSPSTYPTQAYLWMMTNEISNNTNSSLSNTSWGNAWYNPYYMRAVAATYAPSNSQYIRNDLPTYKETTLNACNNVDMVYTGTQSTALTDLPGKPFGSYIYRRYNDGWAKWQKKVRRPQDTVIQSTFGKTTNAVSLLPFLDTASVQNGACSPSYTDRVNGATDTAYISKGLVGCQRINIKSSGALGTSTYNIQTRHYSAFSSTLNHKPEWVALPQVIDSNTTGKLGTLPHTPHNIMQIEYDFPEFITYDASGLVIYNTNPEIAPIVFDALTTPALPVSNIKQIRIFDSGSSSTILIACGNTGLWKITRTYGSVGYNTVSVAQIAPLNVSTPNNCNGFCVFDYDGNRDSTKKWYALFGNQLCTSLDQGSTWVIDSSFTPTGLTVALAQTNVYGIKIDPTAATENLFINYPSALYPNSVFYNNNGYTSGGVATNASSTMDGRGIWYSLSTKVSTVVTVPTMMNLRWGWEYTCLCYNNIWYFSRAGSYDGARYLYYVNHNSALSTTYTICSSYNSTWCDIRPPVFIPTRKFINGVPQYIFHTANYNTGAVFENRGYLLNADYLSNISTLVAGTFDTTRAMQIMDTTYNAPFCYVGRGLFVWLSSNLCYAFHGWDVSTNGNSIGTLWEPHVWNTYGWDGTNWSTSVSTPKATSSTTEVTPTNLRLNWTGSTSAATDFTINDYFTTYIYDGIFKDDSTSFSLTQYVEASISNYGTSFTPSTLTSSYSKVLTGESIRVWNWFDAYRDFTPAGQCTTIARDWDRINTSSVTMWPYLVKENFKLTFYLSSGRGYTDDSRDYLDWKSQGFGFVYKTKSAVDTLLSTGGDFTTTTTNFCAVNIQYPAGSTLATAKTVNCQVWVGGVQKLVTTIANYDPKVQWSMVKNINGTTGAVTVDIIYNSVVIYTCAVGTSDIYYFQPASFSRQDTSSSYTRGVSAWNIQLYGTDYQPKIAVGDGSSTGIWDSNFCYLHMYLYTLGLRTMSLNGTVCTVNANSNRLPAPGELTICSGGYILYNTADTGKVVSGSWRHSLMPTT